MKITRNYDQTKEVTKYYIITKVFYIHRYSFLSYHTNS